MAKPYIHAKSSAKKYGGIPEDYMDIHDFMDSSKACMADVRHRAILHNAFGCFLAERVFGTTRTNSQGKQYSVRDVAEDHIIEDLGKIPSIQDWLGSLKIEPWMAKGSNRLKSGMEEPLPARNSLGIAVPDIPQPEVPSDVFVDGTSGVFYDMKNKVIG